MPDRDRDFCAFREAGLPGAYRGGPAPTRALGACAKIGGTGNLAPGLSLAAAEGPCVSFETMELTEVFQALGRSSLQELIEGISMGRLRTYDVYDSLKVRAHLSKLNRERLRRAVPRLGIVWSREIRIWPVSWHRES